MGVVVTETLPAPLIVAALPAVLMPPVSVSPSPDVVDDEVIVAPPRRC